VTALVPALGQNHVDRAGTHQVSAVINVDQDVDAPWPLEVLDHADQLHKACTSLQHYNDNFAEKSFFLTSNSKRPAPQGMHLLSTPASM